LRAKLRVGRRGELGEPILRAALEVHSALCPDGLTREMNLPALDAFIDTGASRSCIPSSLCRDSRGVPLFRIAYAGRPTDWSGRRAAGLAPYYLLWVNFVGVGPLKVRPFETQHPYFVVGRDLLAHFLTVLDGPSGELGVRTTGKLDHLLRRCLRAP
jgi:hypothetical protein